MGTAAAAVDIFSDGISTAAEAVTDSVKRLAGAEDDGDDEEDAQTILRRLSIELGEVSEELDFTDIANKPNRDEEPMDRREYSREQQFPNRSDGSDSVECFNAGCAGRLPGARLDLSGFILCLLIHV